MNQVQVVTLLNSLEDVVVYYDHAPESAQLPFLEVHVSQGNNFGADNQVYVQGWDFTLDLYTKDKNTALEKEVKDLLNSAGIYWSRNEGYIDDELCYEIEFTFSVWGNEVDPTPTPPGPVPDPVPDPDEGGEDNG